MGRLITLIKHWFKAEPEVVAIGLVLVPLLLVNAYLGVKFVAYHDPGFWQGVLVESHGAFVELIVVGLPIVLLVRKLRMKNWDPVWGYIRSEIFQFSEEVLSNFLEHQHLGYAEFIFGERKVLSRFYDAKAPYWAAERAARVILEKEEEIDREHFLRAIQSIKSKIEPLRLKSENLCQKAIDFSEDGIGSEQLKALFHVNEALSNAEKQLGRTAYIKGFEADWFYIGKIIDSSIQLGLISLQGASQKTSRIEYKKRMDELFRQYAEDAD